MTACATVFDTFVVLGKNSFSRVGDLALQLGDLLVALGKRRAVFHISRKRACLQRFLLLLLVVAGRLVALLPLLLLALRLRAILLTVHGDRLPYPAGKEKAYSRFHVGNRLLVRHKWRECCMSDYHRSGVMIRLSSNLSGSYSRRTSLSKRANLSCSL